jgi:preprotein translocase subunit SecA
LTPPKALPKPTKLPSDYKNFEFELIRFFSLPSPITEEEFNAKSPQEITKIIYKAAFEHYKEKMQRAADLAYPVIENVYKNQGDRFKRIVVPFSDGIKNLNVVTDLKEVLRDQREAADQ